MNREEELAALIAEQEKDDQWGHKVENRAPHNMRLVSLDYTFDDGDGASEGIGASDRDLDVLLGDAENAIRNVRKRNNWTKRQIVSAIKLWVKEHGGVPVYNDWKAPNGRGVPSSASVRRRFGTWSEAIRAAGFEPTPHGGTSHPISHTRLRKRIRKQKNTAFLTPEQIAAAYVIYERQHLSVPQIADRLYRSYGYRNPQSCYTALLRAFHAEGFKLRTISEAHWHRWTPEQRAENARLRAQARWGT